MSDKEKNKKQNERIEELNLSNVLTDKLKEYYFIYTLTQLLDTDISELCGSYQGNIRLAEKEKLINLIHSLGLKFNYEINNEKERQNQNVILDEIRTIGLRKYIEQKGSPKYEITLIEELPFPEDIFNESFAMSLERRFGLTTINQFLKISFVEFKRIFFHSKSVMKVIIDLVHDLGYKFDFELEKENKKKQKDADIYKKKLDRLKKIQAQIEKLQLEQTELTLEIKKLSNQQQLGEQLGGNGTSK